MNREEELELELEKANEEIDKLENEIWDLRAKLSKANFIIETELEPRIKAENRRYDEYFASGERA